MGSLVSAEERVRPNVYSGPTFDPLYGFPEGRQERVMKATKEEMISARMPVENRDYCAHLMMDFYKCRMDVFPLLYKCNPQKHTVAHCQHEDYILRMKEYEREKRLLLRQKRKEAKLKRQQVSS